MQLKHVIAQLSFDVLDYAANVDGPLIDLLVADKGMLNTLAAAKPAIANYCKKWVIRYLCCRFEECSPNKFFAEANLRKK